MLFGHELSGGRWQIFVILATVSGMSSAAVLATINLAAGAMSDADIMANALLVLIVAILLYIFAQKALMIKAAELAHGTVHHLRVQLLETLKAAELQELEQLNRNAIFASVNTEMRVIADGTPTLMVVVQSAVLTVVTMMYLAWLSLAGALLTLVFVAIASAFHISQSQRVIQQHEALFRLNNSMMDGFSDLIGGFKEVKLNFFRAEELSERVSARSAAVSGQALNAQSVFAGTFVASQVTFFLLTGMMVFILPMFSIVDSVTLAKITAATLFLIGPISNVVGGLSTVQRLNAAADVVQSIFDRLQQIGHLSSSGARRIAAFDVIGMNDAAFRYEDDDSAGSFAIGPISLEIARGQVVFVTGGNGSGKSTFLKLLTSLYLPTDGSLMLDRAPLQDSDVSAYRSLFSAIFSDNHLFQEFYGLPDVDPGKVAEYLHLMELEHKVTITGRAFNSISLSSGQRKRLAMIVAILEDRPIYVFDEWAADQDPHFRQKFYRKILPLLKSLGKTIVAVTHDERYFDAADVRYHMEEGSLHKIANVDVSVEQ
jgi:putative ATP-binding cassette transporter